MQTGDPPPRSRLFDFLCRHQSGRLYRAARLRHPGRRSRLALRLRRGRRRHADWRWRSILPAGNICRPNGQVAGAKSRAAPLNREEWKSVGALILLVLPLTPVVGLLRAAGQYHCAVRRSPIPTALDPWPGRLANSRHLVPVVQSLYHFRLHALLLALWARQARTLREPRHHVQDGDWAAYLLSLSYRAHGVCVLAWRRRQDQLVLAAALYFVV